MGCKIIEFLEKELEERNSWLGINFYNEHKSDDDVLLEEKFKNENKTIIKLFKTRKKELKELKEETLEKIKKKLTKEELEILGLNLKEDQNEKM